MTVWKLATNIEYRTLSSLFGLGRSTVGKIVHFVLYLPICYHSMYTFPKEISYRRWLIVLIHFGGVPKRLGPSTVLTSLFYDPRKVPQTIITARDIIRSLCKDWLIILDCFWMYVLVGQERYTMLACFRTHPFTNGE